MAENGANIPLSKILAQTIDKKTVNSYIEIITREELPVFCENEAAKKTRLMPFKLLRDNNERFWEQKSAWKFYLSKDNYNKLMEKAAERFSVPKIEPAMSSAPARSAVSAPATAPSSGKALPGYGSDYETLAELPVAEKIGRVNAGKQKLDGLAESKHKDKEKLTEALVDTAKDAALINRAILEEAMRLGDSEAKKLTQGLVDSTNEMVKSSAALITEDIFSSELMNALVQKSNGAIVQHMTRVYLNGIAFLVYINKLLSLSSLTQKIRASFREKYQKLYHSILPHLHINDITPERVFLGSLKPIPPALLQNWAVGFLIHDVGKAAAVEYHEGEEKYDRAIVIDHVKTGYKYGMTKTNYPMEANMIIGYHHEYYGDPAGYGYFRAYLAQYKKQNPGAKLDYCVTYEKEPLLDYHAFAYFPAKVLEIIDVYDSLTDPNRIYKKPMKPEEAIKMMREEFIEKQLKIDPVIFDIFAAFIEEKISQGQTPQAGGGQKEKTIEELEAELEQNAQLLRKMLA